MSMTVGGNRPAAPPPSKLDGARDGSDTGRTESAGSNNAPVEAKSEAGLNKGYQQDGWDGTKPGGGPIDKPDAGGGDAGPGDTPPDAEAQGPLDPLTVRLGGGNPGSFGIGG